LSAISSWKRDGGKLHNLDGFAQRFAGWGIPYPHFNAVLSAYTEFIGGLLIIFGIATRLASIPMIINMVVAILAVNLKRVSSLDDFVELDEPLYALTFLWLLLSGPGWVSVDYLARRAFGMVMQHDGASQVPHDQGVSLEEKHRREAREPVASREECAIGGRGPERQQPDRMTYSMLY
jgi:putative oxidoreductase